MANLVREREYGNLGGNPAAVVEECDDSGVERLFDGSVVLCEDLVSFADTAASLCKYRFTRSFTQQIYTE